MNCHRFLHETQFYCLILRICYPCEIIIKEVLHVDFTLKKKKEKGFGSSQTGYWGYLPDRLRRPSSSKHLEPFWASTSMETSNTWWCWLFFVAAFSPIFEYSTKKKKKKPNKEDVYMLVKKNKKQTKVGNGFLFLMSKIQMESQIWTRKSS